MVNVSAPPRGEGPSRDATPAGGAHLRKHCFPERTPISEQEVLILDIGIVTNGFPQFTSIELARLFVETGFRQIQLFFVQKDFPVWVYNGRPDMSKLDPGRASSTISNYRKAGLEVLSLAVYTNLLEPDGEEREQNISYFGKMMSIAAENGVPMLATECGFIPGRRGLVRETFEEDWKRFIDSFQQLAELAEKHDVTVALEPCFHDIVNSAKRARDFVDQVGSDRIRIQIDPGNLVTVNTEEEMFANLADVTVALHGKDRKVNAAVGINVGKGDVNWHRFLSLYKQHTPEAPLFLEYVNEDNFVAARDFLLKVEAELD